VTEPRRLRQLEDEDSRLRRLVADLTLDKHMLSEALRNKPEARALSGAPASATLPRHSCEGRGQWASGQRGRASDRSYRGLRGHWPSAGVDRRSCARVEGRLLGPPRPGDTVPKRQRALACASGGAPHDATDKDVQCRASPLRPSLASGGAPYRGERRGGCGPPVCESRWGHH